MEGKKKLQVKLSIEFVHDLDDAFQYGVETFGASQAIKYENDIWQLIEQLSHNYLLFPECRHLPTKSKIYRWIILESHLIIYRITDTQIQVLRMLHSKRSISKIRTSRKIRM
ncbi:MAG: type II toxin-antitoxin system RelE/ParE family toxin [Prolixibacteraceae bacterium]|nr:type II toxin-antitoxin system RelE/ParE family toxin [Prolixibacteraceae bacterium]